MELKLIFREYGAIEDRDPNFLKLSIKGLKEPIVIEEESLLVMDELVVGEYPKSSIRNGLIAVFISDDKTFYIHCKDKNIYCTPYLNGFSSKSIQLKIDNFSDRFEINQSKYSYVFKDKIVEDIHEIDYTIFNKGLKPVFENSHHITNEPYIYMKITYEQMFIFLEYTIKRSDFTLKTISNYFYDDNKQIKVDFTSYNIFVLKTNKAEFKEQISKLKKGERKYLPKEFDQYLEEPKFLNMNNKVYILKYDKLRKKSYVMYDLRYDLLFKKTKFSFENTDDGIRLLGTIKYKNFIPVDKLVDGKGRELGDVVWLDRNAFTVDISSETILNRPDIHRTLFFELNGRIIHSAAVKKTKRKIKKFHTPKIINDTVIVPRINNNSAYSFTILPTLPIYEEEHQDKIERAYKKAKRDNFFKFKKINLYFEKDAMRACESSKYVFEKVMTSVSTKSENYFILDKESEQYEEMKSKWNDNIITRFSFEHYYYVFLSDNFVASELSNHVVATRVLNDRLVNKIEKTPLYFLQHGIMFAKPVDNPMAMGFHKKNQTNNVKKNVISSDLEAGEFYKMGYDDSDLMKTGLPKLDGAFLSENADKITYMPTWRFWEESYILNNKVEETTYFKSLMEVIELFEKEGLIDRLLIAPHNKFSEYIYNNLEEYRHIICPDPTKALEISKIFITDYSSIIYDSTYRGAVPIFYWKDSEYLIEKYQAIPPVNSENAPGIIAWDEKELVSSVKKIIEEDYKISDDVIEKYRKINEFHDNKNTDRVIEVLKNENVL